MKPSAPPLLSQRQSGVLLHITSLPGPHGVGDFGPDAYAFVDWLVGAGQKLWQILPLGGIGPGNSPYMSTSAFAGNVLLIDLTELLAKSLVLRLHARLIQRGGLANRLVLELSRAQVLVEVLLLRCVVPAR